MELGKKVVVATAISLAAQAILPALASLSALLDAAWKTALPGKMRVSSMFDSTQSTSFGSSPCHVVIREAQVPRRASCGSLRSDRPAELLRGSRRRPCGAGSPRCYARSARETAARGVFGQHLADRFLAACMVVRDDPFHRGRHRARRIGPRRAVVRGGGDAGVGRGGGQMPVVALLA